MFASADELPPPRNLRYGTLDAWRGLACVMVVLFHAAYLTNFELPTAEPGTLDAAVGQVLRPLAHFWAGVPVFFVISGYCIAAASDSARRRPRPAGRFFLRRFRRIYPPLWIFLIGTALLHLPFDWAGTLVGVPLELSPTHPSDVSVWSWVGSVTLTEEWRWHFVGPAKDYYQWAVWTLCYEEQFYLLCGLMVLLTPRRMFAAVAVVSAGVFLIVADVVRLPFSVDGFFFGGPWLAFAAGIAVYYRRNYASPFLRRVIDVGLLAATVWAARSVPDWGTFSQSVPAQLTAAFAAAFVIGLFEPFDTMTAKWRALFPLRWCGERCYSLYLVHGPVVYLFSHLAASLGFDSPTATLCVTIPVCVAGSLTTGWASRRWVERRFLNGPADKSVPQATASEVVLRSHARNNEMLPFPTPAA